MAGRHPPTGCDQPVQADAPALLLSGALDPTTPPRWGEEVARGLQQGVHVVMTGVSHSPFPQCAVDVMAAMVEAGTTDGLDLLCFDSLEPVRFVTGEP